MLCNKTKGIFEKFCNKTKGVFLDSCNKTKGLLRLSRNLYDVFELRDSMFRIRSEFSRLDV